uniref:hypothetical protein n=1 Tax=Aeromonas jandaei TaxID=650 RepID=UPI003B9E2D2F
GVKRRAHDADLKRMVVISSPSPQLVPQAASIWETTPLDDHADDTTCHLMANGVFNIDVMVWHN